LGLYFEMSKEEKEGTQKKKKKKKKDKEGGGGRLSSKKRIRILEVGLSLIGREGEGRKLWLYLEWSRELGREGESKGGFFPVW